MAGNWSKPVHGFIPMICCFADSHLANIHPQWVQRGMDGELATRGNKFFSYEWICPNRLEVREEALGFVKRALFESPTGDLRLDNVCFARENYCQCDVCQQEALAGQKHWQISRQVAVTQFVSRCRSLVKGKLYLTVYPDPYPGHLLQRFGVDIKQLRQMVDVFVVPIFDLTYGTTYWLETLAQGFRDLFAGHPWYIELYGEGIDESRLLKAAQVSRAYADGVLIAYATDIDIIKNVEKRLQEN